MRNTSVPLLWRAKAQLNRTVRIRPTCGVPVGDGQKRARTSAAAVVMARPGYPPSPRLDAGGRQVHPEFIQQRMNSTGGIMAKTQRTTCLVVGGGPAGMVLGLLLAR